MEVEADFHGILMLIFIFVVVILFKAPVLSHQMVSSGN